MSDIAYTPILPDGWSRARGFSHAVVAKRTKSGRIAGQICREVGRADMPPGTDARARRACSAPEQRRMTAQIPNRPKSNFP